MAQIVLRVRLVGGDHLDVTYDEASVTEGDILEHVCRPWRKTPGYCAARTATGS